MASRAARLVRLQQLLYYSPHGLTTRELATRLGINQRTVQRDLLTLEAEMAIPIKRSGRRYSIAGEYTLPPVSFSLQEARALLLAARLFLRYSDEADPHGIAALARLSAALPPPVAEQVGRTVEALKGRRRNERFVSAMETITEAWARQRLLRIRYYSRERPEPHEAEVEPYLLEASAPGYSTYLIGYSRTHRAVRTFKIERIEEATMLASQFERRLDSDLNRLLASSWGVIWSDDEAGLEVELKFSAAVATRVREAVWHPSQQMRPLPDGGCILIMQVPSLVEILNWIRSWGPDVEVIRPQELRALVAAEAAKIIAMYAKESRP